MIPVKSIWPGVTRNVKARRWLRCRATNDGARGFEPHERLLTTYRRRRSNISTTLPSRTRSSATRRFRWDRVEAPYIRIRTRASTRRGGSSKSSPVCLRGFLDKRTCSVPLGMKDTTFWPKDRQAKRPREDLHARKDKTGLVEMKDCVPHVSAHRAQGNLTQLRMPRRADCSRTATIAESSARLRTGGVHKGTRIPRSRRSGITFKDKREWRRRNYGLV